jgi:DNA-binding CsgD family transcriptional regulator
MSLKSHPILLLIAVLMYGIVLQAQPAGISSPFVTNFTRSDYHAGTQNWSIQQDNSGLIYTGNNKGLLEFDGTYWQTYTLPNRTIVRSLAFGDEDRLYIGGQNEIGYLSYSDQGNRTYTSLNPLIPKNVLGFEDIWKIIPTPEGIFFCSEEVVFHYENEQLTPIFPPGERFENFFSCQGELLFQDKSLGLYIYDKGQLSRIEQSEIFNNSRIIAILSTAKSEQLIITSSDGYFIRKEEGIQPWLNSSTAFIKQYQAYCAISLSSGRMAIGTAQNGLLIIDRQGNPLSHINQDKGLQNNTVLSMCEDRHKNLWLGLDNGIDYVEINSPFSTVLNSNETGYTSIIHDGYLYLGTNQGLFYTPWNESSPPFEKATFKLVDNTLGQVWNINKLGDEIIICQHKGASYLRNNKVVPFSSEAGAWKFMELNAHPGYAIEGTYSGLYLYKKQATNNLDSDWRLVRRLEGFDESARVFEEDEQGQIWISHAYKGLFRVKLTDQLDGIEKIDAYTTEQGLPNNLFINVAKIRGKLLFTTTKGVYEYSQQNNRFQPYDAFNDIFGKERNVHRLLEDESGDIWFSVDKDFGILKIQDVGVSTKLEVEYFNQIQDDLVDGFEHIYAYDGENVFIGTEKGFIHYNPNQQKNTDFPFDILIRKVTSITEGDSVLWWGNETPDEAPSFHHQANDFRFDYSAPYYEEIQYLEYRYMLEGFEDEWSEWSPKTEKEYTNLTHGSYQFRVQARNAYGQLSNEANYSFILEKPWYLSTYAKTGYLLSFILLSLSLIRYIAKREKRKTEALKKEQREHLLTKEAQFKKEVEKSEGEIIRLKNERLQADIQHKNSQLASATMHLVQKNEIMVKIKNDLKHLMAEASPAFKKKIEQITRTIEADSHLDNNWEQFELYFDQVHENFFKRLRQQYPELTPKDQKLCAYLRMNLSTKEIAPLLNISVRGVEISRYRLRKKLDLDSDTNLISFMMEV